MPLQKQLPYILKLTTIIGWAFVLPTSTDRLAPAITLIPNQEVFGRGDTLRIQCELTSSTESITIGSIQLYCPLVESTVACFMDCQPTCSQSPCVELLRSVECIGKSSKNVRMYEYSIPLNSSLFQGSYSCVYRGTHTKKREVVVMNSTMTTEQPHSKKAVTKGKLPPLEPSTSYPMSTEFNQDTTPRNREAIDNTHDDELTIQLQLFLVIIASAGLMLSLSLNIYCIIRTCLLNHYVKYSYLKPKMTSFFCMNEELNARRQRTSVRSHVHFPLVPTETSSEPDYCPMRPTPLLMLPPTNSHFNTNLPNYNEGSFSPRFHSMSNSPRPSLEANSYFPDNANHNSLTSFFVKPQAGSSHSSE